MKIRIIFQVLFILVICQPALGERELKDSFKFLKTEELIEYNPIKKNVFAAEAVVVIFWAQWCQYCKSEIKAMADFQQQSNGKRVVSILAINVDEKIERGRKIAAKYKNDLYFYHDPQSKLFKKFKLEKLPLTLIYSENGELVNVFTGFNNERFGYMLKSLSKSKTKLGEVDE